jgi:6-phosphofructokinase
MSNVPRKNVFYAQSGGVTSVINASACGLIETLRRYPDVFGNIYAGVNGILGALHEDLIDVSLESEAQILALRHTPGGIFGSCRYKLKSLDQNLEEYQRLIEVFKAHEIGYFFYNGGGDSQDTAHKVSQLGQSMGYPICCIGIPKTVDNDLPVTDCSPGFGSVAKYVAVSTLEASLDVASMCQTSTKVFILEVMGRHAGWIAAASALAQTEAGDPPHIILLPEVAFDEAKFLQKVQQTVEQKGYCVVVVSEGVKDASGRFLSESSEKDAFGHQQLGGVAPFIAQLIKDQLKLKLHWAVSDYLQRSARHIASKTDVEQAYAVGQHAAVLAQSGFNAVMPTIVREQDAPYVWSLGHVALSEVANVEKKLPPQFIGADGFGITDEARVYLQPLIMGEDYPPYEKGIPQVAKLSANRVPKRLPPFIKS